MFGLFKKKSQKEKLEETYDKLIKESYKLSTVIHISVMILMS